MKKILLTAIALSVLALVPTIKAYSQSTLGPGDIAIIRLNGDAPDGFAFVLLADVEANTVVNFTDNGWNPNASALQTGESTVTWTASDGPLSKGTVITIVETSSDVLSIGAGLGSLSLSGSFSIADNGDQLLAYQGSALSPTFLYAVLANSTNWQSGNVTDENRSGLPPGLTEGTHAVAAGAGSGTESEYDNIQYDFGTNGVTGTKAEMLALIGNPSNWVGNDPAGYSAPIPTFTISVFPVELISFGAAMEANHVALTWATGSELNNDYFSVERSSDGNIFTQIGQVEGVGNSQELTTYAFRDIVPFSDTYYYRLRQVDYDGAFSYSSAVEIAVWTEGLSFETFPNPVVDRLEIKSTDGISMNIYSMTSQLVYSDKLTNGAVTADLSSLESGIYIVEVLGDNNSRAIRRIIR